MEPASADHMPVMEYSSGVTVLLFSATNDDGEVVGDERVLHGARRRAARRRASPPANQRPSPSGSRPPPPDVGRPAGPASPVTRAGVAPGDETDGDHAAPHDARHEGQPDPDRPEMRVEHQQTGSAVVTLTRPGCCAVYVDECLTMMVLDRNAVEPSEVKWPTTTTGMLDLEQLGGLPVLATVHDVAPWHMRKSVPSAVGWMEPGTTVPSSRKVGVPS